MTYTYRVYPILVPRTSALGLWVRDPFPSSCIIGPTPLIWRSDGSLVVGFLTTRDYDLVRMLASYSSVGWVALEVRVLPKNEEGTLFVIPDIADEMVSLYVPPVWSSWGTASNPRGGILCMCKVCRAKRDPRDEYITPSPYPEGVVVQYRLWDPIRKPGHLSATSST